jgi:hypothetical protein
MNRFHQAAQQSPIDFDNAAVLNGNETAKVVPYKS